VYPAASDIPIQAEIEKVGREKKVKKIINKNRVKIPTQQMLSRLRSSRHLVKLGPSHQVASIPSIKDNLISKDQSLI
jgi:hypothetical protein